MITGLEHFIALDRSAGSSKRGLDRPVDGRRLVDLLHEDTVVDYVITVPGYPRRVERAVAPRHGDRGGKV